MTLRKGPVLSIVWADVKPEARARLESWAASSAVALATPASGVLSVGRYAVVSGAPAFLEVHELESLDAAKSEAFARIVDACLAALAEAGTIAYTAGGGPGAARVRDGLYFAHAVYRQIFPASVDERNSLHGPAPALQIGRIDIPPQHEEEFNEWYNNEYVIGYFRVPGVYSVRRYLNATAGLPYLTVYELAHVDVSRQPEWDRIRAQSVWRRRIERLWTHEAGSPGIYRRLAG